MHVKKGKLVYRASLSPHPLHVSMDGSDRPGSSDGQQDISILLHAFLRLLFIIIVFVEEGVGHSPSSYQRASPIDDSHVGHVLAMAPSS